jgi:hypothetical protein
VAGGELLAVIRITDRPCTPRTLSPSAAWWTGASPSTLLREGANLRWAKGDGSNASYSHARLLDIGRWIVERSN